MNIENFYEILIRLLLASSVGIVFGLNRSLHHKSAGIKTFSLVAIGTAVAVLVALYEPRHPFLIDGRVLQGVIASLGFLGAGIILQDKSNERIQGLTTAAMLWICAILSITFASGQFILAFTAFALASLYLFFGEILERKFINWRKQSEHPESSKIQK